MIDAAGWVALVATCVAALMTASNLGARVTGWGFAVFTVGAIAWIVVGAATGQTQLLWSNLFLGAVDLFGIWRWIGRARFSDAAQAEEERSVQGAREPRFSVTGLEGLCVRGPDNVTVAHVVDALVDRAGGRIDYLIVREGGVAGVGETLRRLPWSAVTMEHDALDSGLSVAEIRKLEIAEPVAA